MYTYSVIIFRCFWIFSDSWVQALDDKENKLPSKRPVLTDPSEEFGESKVAKIDEVDGFIDASLDIPEINNEVLLSFIMPSTYYIAFGPLA